MSCCRKKAILVRVVFALMMLITTNTVASDYVLDDYLNELRQATASGGTGGGAFDMTSDMPQDPYVKIHMLKIGVGTYRNMTAITGFACYWSSSQGVSRGDFGGTTYTVNFDEDEYITKLSIGRRQNGYTNKYYTTYISIETSKGNGYEYGGAWSSSITTNCLEGTVSHPVAFHGRSGSIIDSLGAYYMQRINLVPKYVNVVPDEQTIDQYDNGALIRKAMVNTYDTTQVTSVTQTIKLQDAFSTSWTETDTLSAMIGTEMSGDVSFFGLGSVKATLKASITSTGSWSVGENTTETVWNEISSTESVTMPPYSINAIVVGLYVEEADVPFEYVYENSFDGREFVIEGIFSDLVNQKSSGYNLQIGEYDPVTYECNVYPEWEGQFTVTCPSPNTLNTLAKSDNRSSSVDSIDGVWVCPLDIDESYDYPDGIDTIVDGELRITD